jgi:glycosyltransferase involved in cell wall biosynthesis/GT2 family glycosyltransferase
MSNHFPSLPASDGVGAKKRRVCIATWEIEGPSRNAGIGTAYTSLADALKRAGQKVTVLFLLGCHPTDGNIIDWVDHYRTRHGFELIPLPMAHHPRIHAAWASSVSYHTYAWLKAHQDEFDIIHFPECQGLGFYSLLAKRQGLAFANTTFVVGTHGPTFWVKEGSRDYLRNLGELEIDFMERTSVAAADVVVSPSQYLLGWMRQNGWELPERTYVVPYVLPQALFSASGERSLQKREVREIVFFGRLELRKGLKLFCDALDELCAEFERPSFKVTFLGKETQIYGRSSIGYICDRSKKWPIHWNILSNMYQGSAIEYLKGQGRLALIASLADNFPNTVLECVGAGVPLLASNVGGISEIIAAADREAVCFEPYPSALTERLRKVLKHGASPAKPSAAFTDVERIWTGWHVGKLSAPGIEPARRPGDRAQPISPVLSVCFAYNVREKGAAATLASIKRQDYPHLEIVVAECGADGPSASEPPAKPHGFQGEGFQTIRLQSAELGAGRNAAAAKAKGEYLFFVDDHVLLLPENALSVFLQVAQRTDADIVTSTLTFFIGSSGTSEERLEHSRRPFLGGDIATGAFVNCFGSANALIRRDAFDAIGGFSDEAVSTLDDWEIFTKAALMGLKIETMPESFVWYREDQEQDSLVHSIMNGVRSVRPYTVPGQKILPSVGRMVLGAMQFGQGLKFERDVHIGSPLSRGEQGPAVTG